MSSKDSTRNKLNRSDFLGESVDETEDLREKILEGYNEDDIERKLEIVMVCLDLSDQIFTDANKEIKKLKKENKKLRKMIKERDSKVDSLDNKLSWLIKGLSHIHRMY
jgi:lipid II:glycine glycyltransferase (peptidoglycan interpeptide bridge formation enzyme)